MNHLHRVHVLESFQELPDGELEVVVRQLLPGANDLMHVGLHERLGDVDIVAVLQHILHAHPSDGLFVADAILREQRESAVAAGGIRTVMSIMFSCFMWRSSWISRKVLHQPRSALCVFIHTTSLEISTGSRHIHQMVVNSC